MTRVPGLPKSMRNDHRQRRPRVCAARRSTPHAGPGSDRAPQSVVETHYDAGGARVSTIRRPDGSTLTVTVPARAMEEDAAADEKTGSWIEERGAGRQPPAAALWRLASLVHAGRTPRPFAVGSAPAVALRPV